MTALARLRHVGRASDVTEESASTGRADPGLLARRERLAERFALLQSELGGLFYEMARRDHVRMDVLTARAAALQRVDAELAEVDRLITVAGGATGAEVRR